MPYIIRDTGSADVATYQSLDDAIKAVEASLVAEEQCGRIVDREREGRWAIYDGFMIKMLWIETGDGSVVSFARHRNRPMADHHAAKRSTRATPPMQACG
jgi:hypothetical protein